VIYSRYGRIKVHRVTPKRAYAGIRCFVKEYNPDHFLTEVGAGRSIWNRDFWRIETPDLKEEYERKELIKKLEVINWKEIPEDKRLAVAEIVFGTDDV
jgi:hypothetical protein